MTAPTMTQEQLAAVKRDMQLEIDARLAKLQAICDAQCESLQARLNRRLNRIPAAQRQSCLGEIVSMHCKVDTDCSKDDGTVQSTAAAIKPASPTALVPPSRKARPAPAAPTTKKATKPTVTKPATKRATKSVTAKSVRGTKRGSDDTTSDDKENAQNLALPKKRVRSTTLKAPVPSKPATTTTARTTRAASRQKPGAAHILSPKTGNASTRQKTAAPSNTRPR